MKKYQFLSIVLISLSLGLSAQTNGTSNNAINAKPVIMTVVKKPIDTLLFDINVANGKGTDLRAGDNFTVTMTPNKNTEGYQFTLNTNGLEVIDVSGIEKGLYAVFADAATFSVDGASTTETITLRLKAVKSGKLSDFLSISNRITKTEAYINGKRLDVAFRFNNGGVSTVSGVGFELYQNQPNPFVDRTSIGFYLPQATTATLTILDETGRLVYTQKGEFEKGQQRFLIQKALLNTTGILHYKVETATDSDAKTMIQAK
jgi:hypothetical protein